MEKDPGGFNLMDCKELGLYLRVAQATIRTWVSKGAIPYVKLQPGRAACVRFDRKEIDAWIRESISRQRRVGKRQQRQNTALAGEKGNG